MSWLTKILGHDVPRHRWNCFVSYEDGSFGQIPVWALDIHEALGVIPKLLPKRDKTVVSMSITYLGGPDS